MKNKDQQELLWKDRKHHLWFPFSFTKYYVQGARLYIKKGFFSTTYEETLLYRITDITLMRTLGHKLFGTGTIILKVQADASPCQHLENIKYPEEVRNYLSELIEGERRRYNVEGREMYGTMSSQMLDLNDHDHYEENGLDIEVAPPPESL